MSVKDLKKRLQACTTWTKESEKGATASENACGETGLVHKKLYTSARARFRRVFLLLYRLVKYQKAVELGYTNSATIELRKCNYTISE